MRTHSHNLAEARLAMANQSHVQMLLRGGSVWNQWRAAHPEIQPDLTGAYLTGADITEANLIKADLRGADLTQVGLHTADLTEAELEEADLTEATLIKADLIEAKVNEADLSGANFTKANPPPMLRCGALNLSRLTSVKRHASTPTSVGLT